MSGKYTAPPQSGYEQEEADDAGPPERGASAWPRAPAGPTPGRSPAVDAPGKRSRYQQLVDGERRQGAGPSHPVSPEPPGRPPPADGRVQRGGAGPPLEPTVVGRGCLAAAVREELQAMPQRPQKSFMVRAHEYVAFLVFGMGCGWVVVGGSYMELPVYQERFGLKASNRMTIGYNVGAASFPIFAGLQCVMQRRGVSIDYRALIVALAAVNALALLGAAFLVDSLEALVLLQVVGGGYGWLTGLVHQRYILLSRESTYVAVFWAGDAASNVLAAALALAQRPELGAAGRRFGPRAFYLGLLPLVPAAVLSFWRIEAQGLGLLEPRGAGAAEPHGAGAEAKGAATGEGDGAWAAAAPGTGLCGLGTALLPAGALSRRRTTAVIAGAVFWANFAVWGFGDSVFPYACARGSPLDGGQTCVFRASFGTVFAKIAGSNVAAAVRAPSLRWLLALSAVFSLFVGLLFLAADLGGPWAGLFDESRGEGSGGYVVFVVLVVRTLGLLLQNLAMRMVQTEYEEGHWESMNAFFLAVCMLANGVAVAIATVFVGSLDI